MPAEMRQMLKTSKTYATYANAEKALQKVLDNYEAGPQGVPYLIACTENGRFAPVVIGWQHTQLAHAGVTVVS